MPEERAVWIMIKEQRDRLLTSLLWGGVGAVGQYTMLFLTIIERIHVRFVSDSPVFYVDPRGPIPLTKDTALSSVWIMTVLYGLLVTLVVYVRPRLARTSWIAVGSLVLMLSVIAALAEPWWGVIIAADFVALCPWLIRRAQVQDSP
ncbi:MAG TPA: hypothetical protein VMY98_05790 [Anaerolineae bacterium]|nr:hypothetical protein [Anaerolineae bacterium]